MGILRAIREGKEGTINLNTLYKRLNKDYFNGSLPTIKVTWSGRLKRAVGRANVSYKGELIGGRLDKLLAQQETLPVSDIEIDMKSLSIKISKGYDLSKSDTEAVMLHEMVHILLYVQKKLGQHHDTPEFDGWIHKLRDASGLDIPSKESKFKKSPKLKAKKGYMIIVYKKDGGFGVSLYSENAIKKKWEDFGRSMTWVANNSSRINKLEGYLVNHPIVSFMTAKRTTKQLQWKIVDEETVRELIKSAKGKKFFEASKGGGQLIGKAVPFGEDMQFNEDGDRILRSFKLRI